MIRFECKNCKEALEAPDSLAGAELKCPKCDSTQTVPGAGNAAARERSIPTSLFRYVGLRILGWIVLPVILLGIFAMQTNEREKTVDAQYSLAGRPDPIRVNIVNTERSPVDKYYGFIEFLVVVGIAVSCWRQEGMLFNILQKQREG